MKKLFLAMVMCFISVAAMQAQGVQYKIVTSVESIVPGGVGRSRIIENGQEVNYSDFTTTRTKDGKEKTSKNRGDVKIEEIEIEKDEIIIKYPEINNIDNDDLKNKIFKILKGDFS